MTDHAPDAEWTPDILGDDYAGLTLPLGPDPDGEGEIEATLVRRGEPGAPPTGLAVLYLHGYTDYFFHRHVAEHFTERGFGFYAIDLRKCGRSRRPGQTPHYVSDLGLYDRELDEAVRIVRAETGARVLVVAHSTGGLVASLWLDRRSAAGATGIAGVVLNSPWFDLQGPAVYRSIGTAVVDAIGRFHGRVRLPAAEVDAYGVSIHAAANGEWDFDVEWKPLSGIPIRFGWIRAVRRGQARLHRGLDIGVPALILRSRMSHFARRYEPELDRADGVLDVTQIQRWAGCLGDRTTIVPIDGARHDVFLSAPGPRAAAFAELDLWLDWLRAVAEAQHAASAD